MIKGISRAALCLLFFVAPAHAQSNSTPVMGTIIEENGSTSLVEVGSNFFFYPVGQFSGPELSYNGTPFVAGQFGAWTPIGVEQTASGYEVAWQVTGADQYTVWNTDSSGNYVSNAIGVVSGSSVALESLEPSFQQDLNGDGVIGVPSSSTPVNGACGSANGVAVTAAPTTGLCTTGTVTTVTGSGPWAWTCSGSNGGTNSSCSAPLQVASTPVDGACGSANGVAVTTTPTAGLCTAGIATTVTGGGPWAWTCNGSNGGTNSSCSAPLQSASPVNGVCGSANGVAVSTAPTGNLCTAGTATTVSGTGPWTWACNGSNGGANASCSAPVGSTGNPLIPANRVTTWSPGLMAAGGIPNRTTIYQTLSPRGGGQDDTAQIQAALDSCPPNQIVKLTAGVFNINGSGIQFRTPNCTLRGAGPGQGLSTGINPVATTTPTFKVDPTATQLIKADRTTAQFIPTLTMGNDPTQWGTSTNLASDALVGSQSVTLVINPGIQVGELVLIDQITDNHPDVWWGPNHDPPGGASRSWFIRQDRSLNQVVEVTAVNGNTISFNTP